jgi:hypothetical protein
LTVISGPKTRPRTSVACATLGDTRLAIAVRFSRTVRSGRARRRPYARGGSAAGARRSLKTRQHAGSCRAVCAAGSPGPGRRS